MKKIALFCALLYLMEENKGDKRSCVSHICDGFSISPPVCILIGRGEDIAFCIIAKLVMLGVQCCVKNHESQPGFNYIYLYRLPIDSD